MFSSKSFIVSGLTSRSLIHFQFIFVYGVKKCSLSFFSRNFLISLLISAVTCWLFRNVLFNLHMFVFFTVFSCN